MKRLLVALAVLLASSTTFAQQAVQRVAVNGTKTTYEPTVNFVPSTGITIGCVANAVTASQDCTFTATGTGGISSVSTTAPIAGDGTSGNPVKLNTTGPGATTTGGSGNGIASIQTDAYGRIAALTTFSIPTGTLSSIGMTVPSFLSVSPATLTSNGTFALALAVETHNTVFAGPSTGTGTAAPTFRALVAADMPTTVVTDTTGSAPVAYSLLYTTGTNYQTNHIPPAGSAGQLLYSNSSGGPPAWQTLSVQGPLSGDGINNAITCLTCITDGSGSTPAAYSIWYSQGGGGYGATSIPPAAGTNVFLKGQGTGNPAIWATAVTSITIAVPAALLTITTPTITTSGTSTIALATQTTNKVFAAPNGSTGTPTFRALVAADIPNIAESQVTSLSTDLAARPTGTTVNQQIMYGGSSANTFSSSSLLTYDGLNFHFNVGFPGTGTSPYFYLTSTTLTTSSSTVNTSPALWMQGHQWNGSADVLVGTTLNTGSISGGSVNFPYTDIRHTYAGSYAAGWLRISDTGSGNDVRLLNGNASSYLDFLGSGAARLTAGGTLSLGGTATDGIVTITSTETDINVGTVKTFAVTSTKATIFGDTDGSAVGPLVAKSVSSSSIGASVTLDATSDPNGRSYSFISTGTSAGAGYGKFAVFLAGTGYVFVIDPITNAILTGGRNSNLGSASDPFSNGYFNGTITTNNLYSNGSHTLALSSGQVDGSSAVGTSINTAVAYATAGSKLLSIQNNSVEKAFFDYQGGVTTAAHTVTIASTNNSLLPASGDLGLSLSNSNGATSGVPYNDSPTLEFRGNAYISGAQTTQAIGYVMQTDFSSPPIPCVYMLLDSGSGYAATINSYDCTDGTRKGIAFNGTTATMQTSVATRHYLGGGSQPTFTKAATSAIPTTGATVTVTGTDAAFIVKIVTTSTDGNSVTGGTVGTVNLATTYASKPHGYQITGLTNVSNTGGGTTNPWLYVDYESTYLTTDTQHVGLNLAGTATFARGQTYEYSFTMVQ